jgi:hypothetical protein
VYTVKKIVYNNYKSLLKKNNAYTVDPGKKLSGKRRKRVWFLEDNWYRSECRLMTKEKLVEIGLNLFPVNGAINGCIITVRPSTIKIIR